MGFGDAVVFGRSPNSLVPNPMHPILKQNTQVFAEGKGVPIDQGRALVEKMVAERQYNEDVWASS